MNQQYYGSRSNRLVPWAVAVLALGSIIWAYWTTLAEAAERWANEPQYSHGYLVPAFAALLLWLRRRQIQDGLDNPSWWGMVFVAGGILLRLVGTHFYYVWFDAFSLLPCLAGLVLVAGGVKALRWAWPSIAFLIFMIPMPYQLEVMLADPLQRFATTTSTFVLQTVGLPALAEGKVILINEIKIGIVEACSGLRMLMIFFALSTGVALVISRPLWEKLLIAASAVPIALVSNILRLTATGIVFNKLGSADGHGLFHDMAGWLMMPVALGLLGLELLVLRHLFLESEGGRRPSGFGLPGLQAALQPTRRTRQPYSPAAQPVERTGKPH
jgi:exosortase